MPGIDALGEEEGRRLLRLARKMTPDASLLRPGAADRRRRQKRKRLAPSSWRSGSAGDSPQPRRVTQGAWWRGPALEGDAGGPTGGGELRRSRLPVPASQRPRAPGRGDRLARSGDPAPTALIARILGNIDSHQTECSRRDVSRVCPAMDRERSRNVGQCWVVKGACQGAS